ncbi:MAG: ATP synthase F1 subunit delta, partial [Bacteroidetes bacterium]|nr:ATP synthase F1 subunit delta [Bacteroidota bacterium]
REDLILDVILAVYDLRREREGILSTTIRSAVELTDDQRRALQDALSAASGKRVDAVYDIDPLLIGGVTVRLGDTVYDGSVRQQLKRLRDRFVRGR